MTATMKKSFSNFAETRQGLRAGIRKPRLPTFIPRLLTFDHCPEADRKASAVLLGGAVQAPLARSGRKAQIKKNAELRSTAKFREFLGPLSLFLFVSPSPCSKDVRRRCEGNF